MILPSTWRGSQPRIEHRRRAKRRSQRDQGMAASLTSGCIGKTKINFFEFSTARLLTDRLDRKQLAELLTSWTPCLTLSCCTIRKYPHTRFRGPCSASARNDLIHFPCSTGIATCELA